MASKSSIILVFLLFCNCYAFSQSAAKINEAELLICENKFGRAAEIYDDLLNQKEILLSPDYFNAALCHIKANNFESAKKHLNKLAQMGVSSGELLNLANLSNPNDWESYMITYNQFYEYGEKDNKYTRFEHKMTELKSRIEGIEDRMRVSFSSDGDFPNIRYYNVIFDKEVVSVIKTDSIEKVRWFKKFDMVRDSIRRTEKYLNLKKEIKELKTQYFINFTTFVKENSWPSQKEINQNKLDQEANSFLQMAKYTLNGGLSKEVYYVGKDTYVTEYSSPSLDSVYVETRKSEILEILNAACADGKVKSSTFLKTFFPKLYENHSNVKAISIYVNEAGCNDFGDKIYFEPVQEEIFNETPPPNLESREDFGKKYVYQVKFPGLFIFGIQPQVEEAHFGSCESARKYFKSKKLFQ